MTYYKIRSFSVKSSTTLVFELIEIMNGAICVHNVVVSLCQDSLVDDKYFATFSERVPTDILKSIKEFVKLNHSFLFSNF